ncbi:DUF6194 family protein [Nocardia sp. NPDC049190]|uniref:DUF6194 family protein n=1 Tax=Nocardia sp. NPDC049190 TaxID=3155650 RepID=UPI0033DD34AB
MYEHRRDHRVHRIPGRSADPSASARRRFARDRVGRHVFYYAPDGTTQTRGQPFATIVTKDYPGDESSRLNRPGVFRLNIGAGKQAFHRWTGRNPGGVANADTDPSIADAVFVHPVYGNAAWLAVVNPGTLTEEPIRELLHIAHGRARAHYRHRSESHQRPTRLETRARRRGPGLRNIGTARDRNVRVGRGGAVVWAAPGAGHVPVPRR